MKSIVTFTIFSSVGSLFIFKYLFLIILNMIDVGAGLPVSCYLLVNIELKPPVVKQRTTA